MNPVTRVLCNKPSARPRNNVLRLIHDDADPSRNVRLALPKFVRDLYRLPEAVLDLIETAAFVYAADRLTPRGPSDALEYQSWSRSFHYYQRVRDNNVWSPNALVELSRALEWVTGDISHEFRFEEGHSTPPSSLFDVETFDLPRPKNGAAVLPFSGGLDSLAGALTLLETTDRHVCLVSHQSQPKTKRTQNALADALASRYSGRVSHYRFRCHLSGGRAPEESQRSRSFLYCTIAFAVATALGESKFYVFENGVTSINFGRRQDLLNARSSRTTHPQTLGRFARLFSLVASRQFAIEMPFLWKTKSDVIRVIGDARAEDLIASAVSCTSTLQHTGTAPQCGECFQCIDRRVAAFAAMAADSDYDGLYERDLITQAPSTDAHRTTLVDYLRQAHQFSRLSAEGLHDAFLSDLGDLVDWLPGQDEIQKVEQIHALAVRHGQSVRMGLLEMRERLDPYEPPVPGSILHILGTGEHQKEEVRRLVESVSAILRRSVPQMFRAVPPKDENDFNRKIGAVLRTHYDKLRSEHPLPRFACAGVVADHELEHADLILESKYIRQNTSPSKASDGLLVDLVKYPKGAHILAVVLDLNGSIPDDVVFMRDIEGGRPSCTVLILR